MVAADAPAGSAISVPLVYLGEFQVTESAPGAVTVEPVSPLEARPDSSADRRRYSLALRNIASGQPRCIPDQRLRTERPVSIRNSRSSQAECNVRQRTAGRREKLIENYVRDGGTATDNDSKVNVYQRVEVVNPIKKDVDGGKTALAEQDTYDTAGRLSIAA